jgi:serine/threonine-protein kinase
MAWTGTSADQPETPLRVEAASWRGRISFVQTVWPWTRATRMQEAPISRASRVMSAVNVAFFFVLLIAALIVSRKNVKAGRGDHRGALRLVTIAAVGQLITWVFNDPHGGDPQTELNRFFQTVGEALFAGGLLYVMYLAIEPAVRRYWPDSLLGWTRLVRGQVLDARVGRDVLVGLAGGALIVVLFGIRWPLQAAIGYDGPTVEMGNPRVFEGAGYVLGFFSSLFAFQATFNAMWCVFAIVGLKRLLKRMWLVAIAASLFFTFVAASGMYTDQPGSFWLNFATAVAVVGVIIVMAIRFGLLAAAATFLVTLWTTNIPWTTATDRWDFPLSALAFGLLAAVALFGAWAARTAVAAGHRDAERI